MMSQIDASGPLGDGRWSVFVNEGRALVEGADHDDLCSVRPLDAEHLRDFARNLELAADCLEGKQGARGVDHRAAKERERCVQLFLAYAFDAHGWKLKDGEDERVRRMLEDLRSGAEVFELFVFLEEDPSNFGMPSIRTVKEVRAWTERHEPTPGEPSVEPPTE